jgi:ABC-type polysaccharide/polyol phosphate export permease
MYPQPFTFPMVLVNFNPMSPLLIAAQDLMVGAALRDPSMLAGAVLLAVLVFLVGFRFFVVVLPHAIALA